MRIGLIVRPREGMSALEELRAAVSTMRASGHEVWPRLTFEDGDGVRLSRAAARAGADLVIAAGGDGTVNEVVNGLLEVEGWPGRVGLVPTGTANDFAGSVGIPADLEGALEVALRGSPREVDVGRVNARYFVNVSTGGFGAAATEETGSETKRLLGPWAYVITGARQFSDLRPATVRLESAEGEAHAGEVLLFAVGNGKQTGGGTMLTPRAELADGLLDVLVVPGMPRLDFLALLPDLRAGTHLDRPDILYFRTRQLRVESDEELSVNADGEPLRGRRFDYGVEPRAIRLMTP